MIAIGKIVLIHKSYIVTDNRRGHVIYNSEGTFENNHGHVKKLGTCKMLLNLIDKGIVPDSSYLRETVLRICIDSKYKDKVINRIKKDGSRQYYFNPNKGIKR